MENLQRIQIGEQTYPIKMDLSVLEHIQDSYQSINQWERDILGIDIMRDKEGHVITGKDGKPLVYSKEPSIKAIRTALPHMINEGLEIEAEQTGEAWEPVTQEQIDRACTTDYMLLAEIIHEEFARCFTVKKSMPAKQKRTMRKRR